MYQIKKRSGDLELFELSKIKAAIKRTFDSCNRNYQESIIETISIKSVADAETKITDNVLNVEDIQDSVEKVLMTYGYEDVAKAYILYRKQHERNRNAKNTLLDYKKTIEGYTQGVDWRVKENSSIEYSLGGLILANSGAITANYWLSEIYDDEIANAHKNCDIHIHDLSMLSGYCGGWSLKTLIKEGFNGVRKKISSRPSKHLSTICNQMINFLGTMSLEWAGAQAFNSVDTLLAPFVKCENLSYKEVKQCIQSLVYGLNTSSRWGSQPVFSNFTFDWTVPDDLAELNCIVGGEELDFKYKDCKREMDMINKAFLETMIEGDADGKCFSYPIPTYSITKDFDWDPDSVNNKLLFEMTAKYGTPYFSNYINSDNSPSDTRSMCCRLRLDLRELRRKSGGFFGSGDNTGSVGVVTLNMPRLAYTSNTEEEFFEKLVRLMDISARSLKIKRNVVTQYLEQGLYPYTKRYLGSFNDHFSTIGLVGMNECCLNARWISKDISTKEGHQFTIKVLDFMRNKLSDYQEYYGDLYNLEATPAESTAYRFAKHDKEDYPDIITAGDKTDGAPYYTNSSHLPVGYTDDIFEALDHQDDLQTKYTSGTVFHAFLGEKLPNWQSAMNLTRKIAENYKLPYFTFSPTYSICQDHGYLTGEQWTCPHCGKPTEVYSRVTGYYRAVQNFNDGKAHEFKDRKEYTVLNRDSFSNIVSETATQQTESTIPKYVEKPILFTTSTCPNCKIVKQLLDNYGYDYDVVVADNDMETARAFDINQAPTLVVNSDSGIVKIANVSNIKKFLDELETEK